jgi:predicted O-methyltransferase YrrM
MASDRQTGSLLRTLAASRPGSSFLELGTGTGVGMTWLLAGMDRASTLDTVDVDLAVQAVARRHHATDPRVTFHAEDGGAFLERTPPARYDFIYADAWPGKYSHLERALSALRPGGVYLIDDLLPQPNWPEGHAAKVPVLVADLEARTDMVTTRLAWSTGLLIAVKTTGA